MEEDQHMGTIEIIWQIDAQISRLRQAKELLSETDSGVVKRRPGRPIGSGAAKKFPAALPPKANTQPRRKMSAAGRARIAAAMKARWAKVRRAAKKATATQKPLVAAVLPKASTKKAASKKVASKKTATKKASPAQTVGPSAPTA
jgi:hypothetical protein